MGNYHQMWEHSRLASEKSVQKPILFYIFIDDLGISMLIKRMDDTKISRRIKNKRQ